MAGAFAEGLSTTAKNDASLGLSLPLTLTGAEIAEALTRIAAMALRL